MRRTGALSTLLPCLTGLAVGGCGEDEELTVSEIFRTSAPSDIAPPTLGPENRVVLALRQSPGQILTVDGRSGAEVDPPFDALPTEHAPTIVGNRVAVITPFGRLGLYELVGTETLGAEPPTGPTTPPVAAAGDTLRLGTTSGRLLSVDAGGRTLFATTVEGAVVDALAVSSDGTTFLTTDLGRLFSVDSTGAIGMRIEVPTPVRSGPILLSDGDIALVAGDQVRIYDRTGGLRSSVDAGGFSGVVAASDGGLLAWSMFGSLRRLTASGETRFNLDLGAALSFPPVALPEGRFAAVFDDNGARTIGPDGAIIGERPLESPPSGNLLRGSGSLVYVPIGATLVALNFAFSL